MHSRLRRNQPINASQRHELACFRSGFSSTHHLTSIAIQVADRRPPGLHRCTMTTRHPPGAACTVLNGHHTDDNNLNDATTQGPASCCLRMESSVISTHPQHAADCSTAGQDETCLQEGLAVMAARLRAASCKLVGVSLRGDREVCITAKLVPFEIRQSSAPLRPSAILQARS